MIEFAQSWHFQVNPNKNVWKRVVDNIIRLIDFKRFPLKGLMHCLKISLLRNQKVNYYENNNGYHNSFHWRYKYFCFASVSMEQNKLILMFFFNTTESKMLFHWYSNDAGDIEFSSLYSIMNKLKMSKYFIQNNFRI